MNIREDYMRKTREYLNDLYMRIKKIDTLKEEIEILKEQDGNYNNINYESLGLKSQRSYRGIEDLVINNENKIYIKETEIEFIESKNRTLYVYLSKLNELEKEVVEQRYLFRKKDDTQHSYKDVSKILNSSESTIKRRDNSAIRKIAYLKYGEVATY